MPVAPTTAERPIFSDFTGVSRLLLLPRLRLLAGTRLARTRARVLRALASDFLLALLRHDPFRRPQHGAAALGRATAAGVDLVYVFRVVLLAADLVVVTKLFALGDLLGGDDEDAALLDLRL